MPGEADKMVTSEADFIHFVKQTHLNVVGMLIIASCLDHSLDQNIC